MELVILLLMAAMLWLPIWLFARLCGWIFNGPRHRRRKMVKYLRDDVRYTRDIYYRMADARMRRRDLW